jgi:polysaccharide biosynthesis transport protein
MRAVSKLRKTMAMVFLGGVGAALGLALLLELYLDPTVKRPQDLGKLQLPLFMSVPMLNGKGKARALEGKGVPLLAENSGGTEQARRANANGSAELAPWDPRHELSPFSEALRDRLITWFELKQMTHKPKLVAVTSCGEGAGVSTIAAGLAASLSETGDGNVLLVDMNLENGGAAHFHKGDLACGLDEALETGKRDQAQVQDKLYMVKETTNSENLPAALPKRLRNLVPRLRASDYDYIIFDMPPVSQISITPRLARFMDIALMVVESEVTDREVVKKASSLLQQSKTNVGVVLNKTQRYVPRALKQDI